MSLALAATSGHVMFDCAVAKQCTTRLAFVDRGTHRRYDERHVQNPRVTTE